MQRAIIAYFVILIILVIVALILGGKLGGGGATTTVAGGDHTSTATTTTGTTTLNTSTQTTTTVFFGSCMSSNATVPIRNGNFSTGTYDGWNVTGPGFGTQPFDIMSANNNTDVNFTGYYGAPWSGYNGRYMATTFQIGTTLQAGNLTSLPFEVTALYLNFKILSEQNQLLYVEILKGNKPIIVAHYDTYASVLTRNFSNSTLTQSTLLNASMPLGTLFCQNISIRLVAGLTGRSSQGTGYIAAGDFYLSSSPAKNPTQPVNQIINS